MLNLYHSIHILLHCFTIYYGKKKTKLEWTLDCDTAFNQLKHALVYISILVMPNFNANFMVETNASDVSVGSVLM